MSGPSNDEKQRTCKEGRPPEITRENAEKMGVAWQIQSD